MNTTQFNKRWHSPINVLMHIHRITKEVGLENIEKSPKYKRVREARIAAIMALVLTRLRNLPTVIRLPINDPPDVYLMQPNNGTMDITTVELTSYRNLQGETLLDQLIRNKIQSTFEKYSSEYILLVELFTEVGVDYEGINNYAVEQDIKFPIWTLRKVKQEPDTIAELVIMNPSVSKRLLNVGEEGFYFKEKYNTPHILYSKKAIRPEDVHYEHESDDDQIKPWDELED